MREIDAQGLQKGTVVRFMERQWTVEDAVRDADGKLELGLVSCGPVKWPVWTSPQDVSLAS